MRDLIALLLTAACTMASAAQGLVVLKSLDDVPTTSAHVVEEIARRKLTLFLDLDHADGAHQAGLALRDTRLIVFGSPRLGTLLMQCQQTMGIDLPVKFLVWKDEAGQVWLGYNDPAALGARHGASDCPALAPLGKALDDIAHTVVGAHPAQ